ncbi:hypothetical protein SNE40_009907 [Patella caerulea]
MAVRGDVVLEERGYLKLPDRNSNYRYDTGTAKESAFDQQRKLLYVVGEDTQMLHVLNLNDVDNIESILNHNFDPAIDGAPLDVELCVTPLDTVVAISFESTANPQAEGHVVLYEAVTIGSAVLTPKNPTDPRITVGAHPENIKFTSDCTRLLVSNEGIPGLVDGEFVDPPGGVSVISLFGSTPSITTVTFVGVDQSSERDRLLGLGVRWQIRTNPTTGEVNPFSHNIEPEYITVSPNNGYAYVTLQENNAVARIDLENFYVANIYPMGEKEWKYSYLDASDRDSAVLMKKYDIKSFYQPGKISFFEWKSKLYLVTADEGAPINVPDLPFTDYDRALSLHTKDEFKVDSQLDAELSTNSQLGRLYVSHYFDGRNLVNGKIETVHTFGGRGFSVFNAQTMIRDWESGDQIEKYSRMFYPDTFNGDSTNGNFIPPQEKDSQSPITGTSLNAIVDGEFNGKKLLILASGKSGLLYVYELADTVSTRTNLLFQSVHRRGEITDTWTRLYSAGTIGDAGIEDLKFIPLNESPVAGSPVLVVVSSKSGTVSTYTFKEEQFPSTADGGVCRPPSFN